MQRIDLTGLRFGRLVVVQLDGSVNNKLMWMCLCDCGTTKKVIGASLRNGSTASCGCFQIEQTKKRRTLAVVGYPGAHSRVCVARGKASEHLCVDCGHPAGDWSYDGLDPQELTSQVHGFVLSYSLNITHYQPRCKSCHTRFDMAVKPRRKRNTGTHCSAGHEYDEANTYIAPNSEERRCRACNRINQRNCLARKAAVSLPALVNR